MSTLKLILHSFLSIINLSSTKEMKQKHNLISQKGRKRINDEIDRLKCIIPECKDIECNKAFVLNKAVKHVKSLTQQNYEMFIEIQTLEKQYENLWMKYQHAIQEISALKSNCEKDQINQKVFVDSSQFYENVDQINDVIYLHPPPKKKRRIGENEENDWELY